MYICIYNDFFVNHAACFNLKAPGDTSRETDSGLECVMYMCECV